MSAQILDGKKLALEMRRHLKQQVVETNIRPGLAVILVGDDPASQVYVGYKEKFCQKLGYYSEKHLLPENTSEEELSGLIQRLNDDDNIHGILVQLPLPKHLNSKTIIPQINPEKDVDGLHPENMGALLLGVPKLLPCTPKGIIKLLEHENISIAGKHAVVIGRSDIVGKPIAQLLLQKNATVSMCHSRTQNLEEITRQADILIPAIGKPKFIQKSMVKEGIVIVDVGVNRLEGGLVGDVDFEELSQVASYITPVPGGVGPMTIACLLENTWLCAQRFADKSSA